MLVRPFVSRVFLFFVVALLACSVVVLVVENTKSVLKTSISRTKDGKKSESEVAMCDRMQMYNMVWRATQLQHIIPLWT
jgi:hypothetical protein